MITFVTNISIYSGYHQQFPIEFTTMSTTMGILHGRCLARFAHTAAELREWPWPETVAEKWRGHGDGSCGLVGLDWLVGGWIGWWVVVSWWVG